MPLNFLYVNVHFLYSRNLIIEVIPIIYDPTFSRLWKAAGSCTHILEGHSDAITSVKFIDPKGINNK